MKKTYLILLVAVMLLIPGLQSFAEYDSAAVVKVMRENLSHMKTIGAAAQSQNYHDAADGLWQIAAGMRAISVYAPPRGSKADWDNTMGAFINAAYRGIGACGAGDDEALGAAIKELQNLNRQGHGAHK